MHAGLRAVAEVDAPGCHDFLAESEGGPLKRLLALDCVQDPGNLVRLPFWPLVTLCAPVFMLFKVLLACLIIVS